VELCDNPDAMDPKQHDSDESVFNGTHRPSAHGGQPLFDLFLRANSILTFVPAPIVPYNIKLLFPVRIERTPAEGPVAFSIWPWGWVGSMLRHQPFWGNLIEIPFSADKGSSGDHLNPGSKPLLPHLRVFSFFPSTFLPPAENAVMLLTGLGQTSAVGEV